MPHRHGTGTSVAPVSGQSTRHGTEGQCMELPWDGAPSGALGLLLKFSEAPAVAAAAVSLLPAGHLRLE